MTQGVMRSFINAHSMRDFIKEAKPQWRRRRCACDCYLFLM
jgi:hypothetical protein